MAVVVAPMGRGKSTDIEKAIAAGRNWTDTDVLGAAIWSDAAAIELLETAMEENTAQAWANWSVRYSQIVREGIAALDVAPELLFVHSRYSLATVLYSEKYIMADLDSMEPEATGEDVMRWFEMEYAADSAIDAYWIFNDPNDAAKRVEQRELDNGVPAEEAKMYGESAKGNAQGVLFDVDSAAWPVIIDDSVLSIFEAMDAAASPSAFMDIGTDLYDYLENQTGASDNQEEGGD